MARGINKVILIGNLGKDPETRNMPSGGAVANLALATSESWKDKTTGERQERTEWHRVVCFARLGEIAGEYLRKGSKVYIEGRLQTRKWQDKQSGQDRYTTEIVANDLQMLDGANVVNHPANRQAGQPQQQPQQRAAAGGGADFAVPQQGGQPAQQGASEVPAYFDDDIPF